MFSRSALVCAVVICSCFAGGATAGTISWNTQGQSTDVANGILSFDELTTSLSHTYVNVGGDGFDIKVSVSALMTNSTGDLNYTVPNSSISFEFFATGTANPIALTGFQIDWRDDDVSYGGGLVGPFEIVNAGGVSSILDTSSGYFSLGSSLSTTDLDGANGVNPDGIESSASGDWNNLNISFITDLSSVAIRSFSIVKTTDWIAPTSLQFANGVAIQDIASVPIPAPGAIALLGLGLVALVSRRRRTVSRS